MSGAMVVNMTKATIALALLVQLGMRMNSKQIMIQMKIRNSTIIGVITMVMMIMNSRQIMMMGMNSRQIMIQMKIRKTTIIGVMTTVRMANAALCLFLRHSYDLVMTKVRMGMNSKQMMIVMMRMNSRQITIQMKI